MGLETLPKPQASSHDQNVVVGYNNLDFHIGTVAMGVGTTLLIIVFILLCYCAGRKLMRRVVPLPLPAIHHHPVGPQIPSAPRPENIYARSR